VSTSIKFEPDEEFLIETVSIESDPMFSAEKTVFIEQFQILSWLTEVIEAPLKLNKEENPEPGIEFLIRFLDMLIL